MQAHIIRATVVCVAMVVLTLGAPAARGAPTTSHKTARGSIPGAR